MLSIHAGLKGFQVLNAVTSCKKTEIVAGNLNRKIFKFVEI